MFSARNEMAINISLLPKRCHGLQASLLVCWIKGILFCSAGRIVSFAHLCFFLGFIVRSAGR